MGDIIFPSMIEINVELMFNNFLKYHINDSHKIDFENSSVIVPFAQSQIVHNFLRGIDPDIKNYMYSFMETLINEHTKCVTDFIDKEDEKEQLVEILTKLSEEKLQKYQETLYDYQQENFIQPIVNSVKLLPKEELAIMAETVGGPIDVALISKGDGLIWIKRKHYFDPALNQAYLNRKGQI